MGEITEISGSLAKSEIFIKLVTFMSPGIIYRYDFAEPNAKLTVFRELKLNVNGFDPMDFEKKQILYRSQDGTKIPMFFVQKRTKTNMPMPKPVLLHGDEQFDSGTLPHLNGVWLYFVDVFGGIVAFPSIRRGSNWHQVASGFNKQRTLNDLQYAAKYLIEQNYAEHGKIAVRGGMVIGDLIKQYPDVFGAAVAEISSFDMSSSPKFTTNLAFSHPFHSNEQRFFQNMVKYSPLDNAHLSNSTSNQLPSMLLTTHDRNSLSHALDFAATLQNSAKGNRYQTHPIIMKIYQYDGRDTGKAISNAINENTDILTFLYRAMNIADGTVNGKFTRAVAPSFGVQIQLVFGLIAFVWFVAT